jgi:septum formation protein
MGITRFSIDKSDFAEDLGHEKYETAAAYCEETARHKLEDVAQKIEKKGVAPIGTILLGADTIVEVDGKILEKPRDFKEAYDMISRLSGSRHTVHTAVVIFSNGNLKSTSLKLLPVASFVESTFVNFIPLSESDKLAYIETKEGFDKAGGYGIQGFGGQMVEKIDGCYFNVMGLPITSLSRKLASLYYEDKI